jgi:hypothetical protein
MLGEQACWEHQTRRQETERDLKKTGSPTPHSLILDLRRTAVLGLRYLHFRGVIDSNPQCASFPVITAPMFYQGTTSVRIREDAQDYPGFPARCSGQVCVCGFLHGKPHEAPWFHQTAQDIRVHPGIFSAVPAGTVPGWHATQDCVLGYSQPSLRDWVGE